MNMTDGACTVCGIPTAYDQRLPILCRKCRISGNQKVNASKPTRVASEGVLGMLINNTMSNEYHNPLKGLIINDKLVE
jgi:hypothetical protein